MWLTNKNSLRRRILSGSLACLLAAASLADTAGTVSASAGNGTASAHDDKGGSMPKISYKFDDLEDILGRPDRLALINVQAQDPGEDGMALKVYVQNVSGQPLEGGSLTWSGKGLEGAGFIKGESQEKEADETSSEDGSITAAEEATASDADKAEDAGEADGDEPDKTETDESKTSDGTADGAAETVMDRSDEAGDGAAIDMDEASESSGADNGSDTQALGSGADAGETGTVGDDTDGAGDGGKAAATETETAGTTADTEAGAAIDSSAKVLENTKALEATASDAGRGTAAIDEDEDEGDEADGTDDEEEFLPDIILDDGSAGEGSISARKIAGISLETDGVYEATFYCGAEWMDAGDHMEVAFEFKAEAADGEAVKEKAVFSYDAGIGCMLPIEFADGPYLVPGEDSTMHICVSLADEHSTDGSAGGTWGTDAATPSDAEDTEWDDAQAQDATPSDAAEGRDAAASVTEYSITTYGAEFESVEAIYAGTGGGEYGAYAEVSFRVKEGTEPGIYFGDVAAIIKDGDGSHRLTQGFLFCIPGDDEPMALMSMARAGTEYSWPDDIIRQAWKIMEGMDERQKIGQLFFLRSPGNDTQLQQYVRKYSPGGFVYFKNDFDTSVGVTGGTPEGLDARQTMKARIQTVQDVAMDTIGIPLLIAADEEGGLVTRISSWPAYGHDQFGSPLDLKEQAAAAGVDPYEFVEADGEDRAAFLQDVGVNVNLAPVADVANVSSAFLYNRRRTWGGTAQETAQFVAATVRGMEGGGTGTCLKHFPGYGNSTGDTHMGKVIIDTPINELIDNDIQPFLAGVEAGNRMIMITHNTYTDVDPDYPACLSETVYQFLRENGYDGVTVTDDLAMKAVMDEYGKDAALMALKAGADIAMIEPMPNIADLDAQIKAVTDAAATGELSQERINESCRRVLCWKIEHGLIEREQAEPEEPETEGTVYVHVQIGGLGGMASVELEHWATVEELDGAANAYDLTNTVLNTAESYNKNYDKVINTKATTGQIYSTDAIALPSGSYEPIEALSKVSLAASADGRTKSYAVKKVWVSYDTSNAGKAEWPEGSYEEYPKADGTDVVDLTGDAVIRVWYEENGRDDPLWR
ncbi:MAG: hypothetical protein NC489_20980, partial [Ruminococcus flavefaciens]|nr:hypothetical protein [Ruminococcus flavefaciens]